MQFCQTCVSLWLHFPSSFQANHIPMKAAQIVCLVLLALAAGEERRGGARGGSGVVEQEAAV